MACAEFMVRSPEPCLSVIFYRWKSSSTYLWPALSCIFRRFILDLSPKRRWFPTWSDQCRKSEAVGNYDGRQSRISSLSYDNEFSCTHLARTWRLSKSIHMSGTLHTTKTRSNTQRVVHSPFLERYKEPPALPAPGWSKAFPRSSSRSSIPSPSPPQLVWHKATSFIIPCPYHIPSHPHHACCRSLNTC